MLQKPLRLVFSFAASFLFLSPLQAEMYVDDYDDFSCCEPCHTCQDRFWLEADYLYWEIQSAPKVIPLVVEQSTSGTPVDVVLGGKKYKDNWHSGARFALGYWFDECRNWGAEVSYFFLGKESKHSSVESDANGSPGLRVPYFDVTTGQATSSPIALPGVFRGGADLKLSNEMQGAELNLVKEIPCRCSSSFQLLAGFRYWNFEDNLTFFVDSPLVVRPTIYNYKDKFETENNFYGGQIGASFKQNFSSFFFDVKGKIALGAMCQKSTIKGHFHTNEFTGSEQTFLGGFFALPTNIGHHDRTRFSVIPELNVNLGYYITDCFCIRIGYSVLYVTEVLRASKQMNNHINPTQSANIEFTPTPRLAGEASPTGKLRSNNLWVQGFNVGLDFTF